MQLTRYITEANTMSVTNILEFGKTYEMKAAPGAIRLRPFSVTGIAHKFDGLITPNIQYSVQFPAFIMEKSGFFSCQNVYVFKKDADFYLLDPAYSGSTIKAVRNAPVKMPPFRGADGGFFDRAAAADYELRVLDHTGMSFAGFSQVLGFDRKEKKEVACSIFHDGAHTWLEVRKAGQPLETLTRQELNDRYRVPMSRELNGLTYSDTLKPGRFLPPAMFRQIASTAKRVSLPVWFDESGQCVVIECPIRICATCGETIRSTSKCAPVKVHACDSCIHEMGPTGMVSAIIQAEKALDKATPFLHES